MIRRKLETNWKRFAMIMIIIIVDVYGVRFNGENLVIVLIVWECYLRPCSTSGFECVTLLHPANFFLERRATMSQHLSSMKKFNLFLHSVRFSIPLIENRHSLSSVIWFVKRAKVNDFTSHFSKRHIWSIVLFFFWITDKINYYDAFQMKNGI